MMTAIESVTVGVRDLDGVLAFCRDTLGYRVEHDLRASVSLLAAWKLPVHADVRLVTLSCDGHGFGRIRLAHWPQPAGRADGRPTDAGPKALDLYTGAPIGRALERLAAAGCTVRSAPQRFHIGSNDTEEAVVEAPGGLPLLVMVGHGHVAGIRRLAPGPGQFSEVATVSIVTQNLDASRRFYEEALGWVPESTDVELRGEDREAACRLYGVAEGARVHMAVYRERRQASGKVVLLHFYDRTTPPPAAAMRPGLDGFSMLPCRCPDLEALAARLGRAGGQVESVIQHVAVDAGVPCRVMLVRSPSGELFECIER